MAKSDRFLVLKEKFASKFTIQKLKKYIQIEKKSIRLMHIKRLFSVLNGKKANEYIIKVLRRTIFGST